MVYLKKNSINKLIQLELYIRTLNYCYLVCYYNVGIVCRIFKFFNPQIRCMCIHQVQHGMAFEVNSNIDHTCANK